MQDTKKQPPGHAEHVARRAFIKKAAVGAALAVPVIESFTASDMLAKAATASSGLNWTITTTFQELA
jgi:hypothetical protein